MEASGGTSSPRPFGEIFGLWLKVFQMDEPFFFQNVIRDLVTPVA